MINDPGELTLSVLDLAHVTEDGTVVDAFRNTLDLARHTERFGYKRYWLAEHHNMAGIASSATSLLIAHVAGGTSTIRVGSGGIMLPNHSPLVIAEQFGTLESLFPGRIDLGLGRAPGTDQLTAMALRRSTEPGGEDFVQSLAELRQYFSADNANARVRAIPGEGLDIPIWLLGSSTYSAQLAAMLGLPFAFASHFAPNLLHAALQIYRDSFRPSQSLKEPYFMACVNVSAADTVAEAESLSTSLYIAFLNVIRGTRTKLQAPVKQEDMMWNEAERYAVQQMLAYTFIGDAATLKAKLQAFADDTGVNEIIASAMIYDHQARVKSYKILSELGLKRNPQHEPQKEVAER